MRSSNHEQQEFLQRGWQAFEHDEQLLHWVRRALPAARASVHDPAYAEWLRYRETWFAGVNALPNNARGEVDGSGHLAGNAVEFALSLPTIGNIEWDRAQVSVCYPGYPQPTPDQSDTLFRFRRDRDAAHVDGLLPEGPDRRRHLREFHAFILGIPMVDFSANAAPFVVWEGSHHIIRNALAERLVQTPPERWGDEDITDTYQAARLKVFDSCRRVELHAEPGQAFLVHRLCVHGMAPWHSSASAGADGRMICYFRPELANTVDWLHAP